MKSLPEKLLFVAGWMCLLLTSHILPAQEVFYNPYTQEVLQEQRAEQGVPTARDFYIQSRPLDVILESDFTHLKEHKSEREYQPATLHVRFSDSLSMRCPVRIKARGNSRLEYCDQPPLKIDFTESGLRSSSLRNLQKVKLVSNCKQGVYFDKYVFREFLAYKLYNQLTEKSFRVRLAKIVFVDTAGKGKSWENYGFVIEETDALARREQMEEIEERGAPHAYDRNGIAVLSMFEYMIGNTDWHLPSSHNIKLFRDTTAADPLVYAVPYDFDLSGLVQSVYAQPRQELNQKHVKDRIFIGHTVGDEDLAELVALFQQRKPYFYQVIADFPHLRKGDKKLALRYLDDFYDILEDPGKRRRYLLEEAVPYDW